MTANTELLDKVRPSLEAMALQAKGDARKLAAIAAAAHANGQADLAYALACEARARRARSRYL